MKVLVIGGGGREHAIIWALKRSPAVTEIVAAPGNGGIAALARCAPVDVNSLHSMVDLVAIEQPALTVVGPEVPLALGLVDELQKRKLRVFGPTKDAAQLEILAKPSPRPSCSATTSRPPSTLSAPPSTRSAKPSPASPSPSSSRPQDSPPEKA